MFARDKEFIDDQLRGLTSDSIKLWEDDMAENYTINFMLDKPEWKREYEKLVYEFEKIEKGLYIYPFERLHMTVLGRIDIKTDLRKIESEVRRIMCGNEYKFKIGYLANNNQGVSIISEPVFDLEKLRDNIRQGLGVLGDDYTKYSNIYERISWLNFMRFKDVPGEKFFETMWNMRNFWFGEFEAKEIYIFRNSSRTLDPKKCFEVGKIVF